GYSIYYEGKKLVIKVKRQPSSLDLLHLKIAVDAGHGGDNSGATGVTTNIQEKNYTLLIAKELEKALLQEKASVFMTRNIDFSLSGPTEYPNCLVEVAFLSNKEDERRILDPQFHQAVARQITEGIKKWLADCREDK